jgi:hypothetical protein
VFASTVLVIMWWDLVWTCIHSCRALGLEFFFILHFLQYHHNTRSKSRLTWSLSDKMDGRLLQHDILDAFGIIWEVNRGKPLIEGGDSFTMPKSLSALKLEVQQGLFKVTMKANAEVACTPPFIVNPLMKLWQQLISPRHLCKLISEYVKVGRSWQCASIWICGR